MSHSKHERNDLNAVDREPAKKPRKFTFPGRHQNGAAAVYRNGIGYRDNSSYLETVFNSEHNALLFARPMQLGKTTLLSLADELFSVNKTSRVDDALEYSPDQEDRNKWFVLRVDFGQVHPGPIRDSDTWESIGQRMDQGAAKAIRSRVMFLLLQPQNHQLFHAFNMIEGFDSSEFHSQSVGSIISSLSSAVETLGGRLLFLVDEYDLPIRDCLLLFLPDHGHNLYANVRDRMKATFGHYFEFFRVIKQSLETMSHAKLFLTGITPIGIKGMSGLTVTSLTFEEDMADAVGLTKDDVVAMLQHIDFNDDEERDRAFAYITYHFKNLYFPGGSALYHTALVNGAMNMLLKKPKERSAFLANGVLPEALLREGVTSTVYSVLRSARNLRHVVNMLAEGLEVTGYNFNENLSLEHLLQHEIDIGDYLTLLVHLGVVAARGEKGAPRFTLTSSCYQKNLLEPLLETLETSLVTLTSLTTQDELYAQGEDILVDFVTSISRNNMAGLMAWAASDDANHILELQFQSHVVTGAHQILTGQADTTQEDVLETTGKRTDVTFSSDTCVVILELKQVSEDNRTPSFLTDAHQQLSGHVATFRKSGAAGRPVAGFVVVMCSNGANYVVEKLRSEQE